MKSQAIPPKILNVILIHLVLGRPTFLFPFALVNTACLGAFSEAFVPAI